MKANKEPHLIKFEDLQNFLGEHRIVYAQSDTKRMLLALNGNIEILIKKEDQSWVFGKLKWQGKQPYVAIENYNSLP